MVILETSVFTRRIHSVLDPESYRLLQLHLLARPDAGTVVPGSGGIRKIRWASSGSGKRGGARVLYYWVVDQDSLVMLYPFAKNEMAVLNPNQIQELASLVRKEFK